MAVRCAVVRLAGGEDFFDVPRPSRRGPERPVQGAAQRGQLVLDPGRHLGVHVPLDEAVAFEVAQRLGQDLPADPFDRGAQVAEAHAAVAEHDHTMAVHLLAIRASDVRDGQVAVSTFQSGCYDMRHKTPMVTLK